MPTCTTRTAAKMAALVAAAIVSFVGSAAEGALDDAQNQTEERLLACDSISDPAEKMACFNGVVERLKESNAVPAAESPSAPTPASDTTAATAAASATAVAIPAAPSEPEPAADLHSSTGAGTPVEPTAAADTAEDNFGIEDVKVETAEPRKEEEKEEIKSVQATITDVWTTIDGRFEVRLDNGQVWRETSGSRIKMPIAGSIVQIKKGRLGSYRMKIGNDNRLAFVRRTK